MRYKNIISFFLCMSLLQAVYSQHTPAVREVIHKFYATYNLSAFASQHVDFEKRKGDWYVVTIDYDGLHAVRNSPFLFYSSTARKYLELGIDRNGTERRVRVEDYMDEYTISNFDLQPFYGYPGWYNDVITELELATGSTDDQVYALGRAYSAKAAAMITNPGTDAAPGDQVTLYFNSNTLQGEALEMYNRIQDSAIAKFGLLALRNKKYSTRVGNITMKYANEWMVKYHTLLTFAADEALNMKLPDGLYSEEETGVARALLTDCPANSIFLSLGDNDFYPLLYLQQTEGFRKDVHVINYNLLGLDKYIYRATQPQLEAAGVHLSADTTLYAGKINEYHPLQDSSNMLNSEELFRFLRSQAAKVPGNDVFTVGYFRLFPGKAKTGRDQIPLGRNRYLLKNHWVLLDILASLGDRKLCMAYGFYDEMEILNPLFVSSGAVRVFDN